MGDQSRVFIVTGGNSGIGYATALHLVKQGHTVIIGCRSRLDEAVSSIRQEAAAVPGVQADIAAYKLDLACLQSVKEFAAQLKRFKQVHGLVLNAGVNNSLLSYSTEGVEATFATNHLGHFYLTSLLQPLLAPDARVVVTSSGTHDPANRAPMPKPHWQHPSELAMLSQPDGQPHPAAAKYRAFGAYANSKLCNVLFAYALAQRLQQQSSRVTAVAYNPGFVAGTAIFAGMPRWLSALVSRLIPVMMLLLRGSAVTSTVEAAGVFQARLAADPEFQGVTGVYYQVDRQAPSSADSYDSEKGSELWAYSEQLLQQFGFGGS